MRTTQSVKSSASDEDIARDMREAYLDHAEQVAKEFREMEEEDERAREQLETEIEHEFGRCTLGEVLAVPAGFMVPDGYRDAGGGVLVRDDGVRGLFGWHSGLGSWSFTEEHEANPTQLELSAFSLFVPVGVSLEDKVPVVKSECGVCGYVVNPVGHAARCKVRSLPSGGPTADELRAMAWLGDSDHTRDVRRFLVATGTPAAALEVEAQKYLVYTAQAAYYRAYDGDKVPTRGTSDRSLSTAFEASYSGLFRRRYLAQVLPAEQFLFSALVSRFFDGFPYVT